MKISKAKATEIIKNSQGKFITVKFTKKNGEDRTLTGRTGVHQFTTGEGLKYNPDDYGLVNSNNDTIATDPLLSALIIFIIGMLFIFIGSRGIASKQF